LLGDFDVNEHLRLVVDELCALAATQAQVRAIAVHPDGMEDVLIYDGRLEHSLCDRALHRKLIDALGALVGRCWFVIDCQTRNITLDEIETARSVVRALNQVDT
jgi:hypothetical protein